MSGTRAAELLEDVPFSFAPVDPDWTEVFPNEFVSQHPVTLPAPFEEAYETTVPDTTSVSIVIGPDDTLDMDEMIRLYGPALGDILERLPDYLMNPASSSALYD